MKTKLSVSRCCCAPVGCSTPTCQYDDFSTYGTGNSIYSNLFYDSSISDATATQLASEQCRVSAGTASDADLYFRFGVSGSQNAPDFLTGYSNKTYVSYEIKDVADITQTCSIAFHPEGEIAGVDFPYIRFSIGYVTTNSYRKRVSWRDVDGVEQVADINFSGTGTKSYYQHEYQLEIYDYLQQTGSDSVSRASFQWKLLEDGVVLLESNDGTTQQYNRFAGTVADWCNEPRGRIQVNGFAPFGSTNYTDIDNLKLSVNGDASCLPTVPPVPPI